MSEKRALVDSADPSLTVSAQREALGLSKSTFYYESVGESAENLRIMRQLDELYIVCPFYGYRRMTAALNRTGYQVNEKRVRRLMQKMGLEAIYPKPSLSRAAQGETRYPYLLRDLKADRCNQVWSTDITYIPMKKGSIYLVAVMDWFSRYILAWELSNTLDDTFCLDALSKALERGCPESFNTDQGAQFTSKKFTSRLEERGIRVSWDGRGRALDNVFIERLWRSLKYEEVYLNCYETVPEAAKGIARYLKFYNEERLHQSVGYRTPWEAYNGV